VLLLLAVPGAAQADVYERGLDFSMVVSSSKTRWLYDHVERETRIKRLAATWLRPLGPSLRGGLRIAYLDMSQAGHPQAVGLNTTGTALGIELQQQLVKAAVVQLALRFAYDYARSEHASGEDRIENDWTTTTLGLDMIVAPRQTVSVLAGSSWVSVDGEERLSGSVNQVTAFEEDDAVGYYAGLSIKTDKSGRIGLRWYGGQSEGLFLNFSRRY